MKVGGRWSEGKRPLSIDGEGFFQNSYGGRVAGFNGRIDTSRSSGSGGSRVSGLSGRIGGMRSTHRVVDRAMFVPAPGGLTGIGAL